VLNCSDDDDDAFDAFRLDVVQSSDRTLNYSCHRSLLDRPLQGIALTRSPSLPPPRVFRTHMDQH